MLGLMLAFIIVIILISNIHAKDFDNYGLYNCDYSEFSICAKAKNVSAIDIGLIEKDGEYTGSINVTLANGIHLDEIRIAVYSSKGKTKTVLWSYNVKDPCQHFLIATIMSKFNAHNCNVDKGLYSLSLNFSDMLKSLLGSSFFYGEYIMKTKVLSKKEIMLCVITKVIISRKDAKEINT